LDQIQWRLKDTGFTDDLLKKWMKEHKSSINQYLTDVQKSEFFPNYNVNTGIVSDDDIVDFVNNNYNKIFKSSK